MKTSKKILSATAVFTFLPLIVGLFVVRNDLQTLYMKEMTLYKYEQVNVGQFTGLDFSGPWTVKIIKGKDYKVELGEGLAKESIENRGGTLCFTANGKERRRAKITVPSLQTLKAKQDASIEMTDFKSDSIVVTLGDSATFKGRRNKFKQASLTTSGKAWLQFIDNMDL